MTKVLIIDSELSSIQALRDALVEQGVETTVVADGNEGLNMVRSFQPDAIVLCVELSRVSGYSICNKLKKDAALSNIPLVLTSSQATEETFEQHKRLKTRAEGYVRKPFAVGEMLAVLSEHVAVKAPPGSVPQQRKTAAPEAMMELETPLVSNERPASAAQQEELATPMQTPSASRRAAPAPLGMSGLEESDAAHSEVPPPPPPVEDDPLSMELDLERELGRPTQQTKPELSTSGDYDLDALRLDSSEEFKLPKRVPQAAPAPAPAPASTPAPAPVPAPRRAAETPLRASTPSAIDGQSELLRQEVRQLRHKVSELEQQLQSKEIEFNDRLLQESTRGRDSVELKKKVTMLERDMSRYAAAAEKSKQDAERAVEQASALRNQLMAAEQERQEVEEKNRLMTQSFGQVQQERAQLQERLVGLDQAHKNIQQENELHQKARQKAKKAIDIAVQLLDETGLTQASPH